MKLKVILNKLDQITIDEPIINKIETLYKTKLPDDIKKIISLNQDGMLYDDADLLRGLSADEILNAAEDLWVEFTDINALPLFDTGDNDFIIFKTDQKCFYKFNIVDEIEFDKSLDLLNYIA